eukprot:6297287-Prymnesium_polylepis.1
MGGVAIFLVFALLTFCRIRLKACIKSHVARRARDRDLEANTVELQPLEEQDRPPGDHRPGSGRAGGKDRRPEGSKQNTESDARTGSAGTGRGVRANERRSREAERAARCEPQRM